MPGRAKMTCTPASDSDRPNQPSVGPYTSIRARPTTIGETETGMSSSTFRNRRPANR